MSTHQAQEFEAKQAEILDLTKQVQDLNSQLQAQRTLVVTLETEKQCREELEREAASVRKAELDSRASQILTLTSQLVEVQGRLASAELEARRAREVDVEALTLSLSSKTSELAALTQQCELLTQKLQGREEACRGLEGTVSHLEQQRQALTEQLLRTQEQGGGEVSKLQVQAATLTARLAEAERGNASLQEQLLELHSRREAQERSQQEAACVEERRKVSTHALSLTHTYTHTHTQMPHRCACLSGVGRISVVLVFLQGFPLNVELFLMLDSHPKRGRCQARCAGSNLIPTCKCSEVLNSK